MTLDLPSDPVPRWHMAAWSEEIGEALLSRRLNGSRNLLYRKDDGQITAMDDRCPHRFAPLSLGDRRGNNVHCGYHGLGFNAQGECIHNPFSDRIPRPVDTRASPNDRSYMKELDNDEICAVAGIEAAGLVADTGSPKDQT